MFAPVPLVSVSRTQTVPNSNLSEEIAGGELPLTKG